MKSVLHLLGVATVAGPTGLLGQKKNSKQKKIKFLTVLLWF